MMTFWRTRRGLAVATIAIASIFTSIFAAHAQPNIDHYTQLPNAEWAAISPDGNKIAMIQGAGGDNRMVAFYPLDGSRPSRVDLGEMKARDITWVSNDKVIVWATVTSEYLRSGYTFEFARAMSIDEPTGKVTWLFSKDPKFSLLIGAPRLLHTLPNDPEYVLMEQRDPYSGRGASSTGSKLGNDKVGDEWAVTVYRANLNNGKVRLAEAGNKYTSYFKADAQGNIRLRSDYVDGYDRREFHHRAPGEKKFTKIAEFAEDDGVEAEYQIAGLSNDGASAFAYTRGAEGRRQFHKYSLDGTLGPVVWSNSTYDLDGWQIDDSRRTVVGIEYTADLPEQMFLDADLKTIHTSLKSTLRSYDSVTIEYWSSNRNMFVVRAQKAGAPQELLLYDRAKKEISFIASNYPSIPKETLGGVERFDHRTSDGLNIPGYLLTPAAKEKSNLPLIVLPHGGPWARDSMEFDWEAQYYTALGYAVYKPNFRGSEGFGLAFREAGYREWGAKMQDDITEGVRKLIVDGIADPSRICIVGGSYGGYAALMGGAKTPELYRCVVSYAGVTDIPGLFRYDETYGGPSSEGVTFMRRSIGNMREDAAMLRSISPVNRAENFTAPVLLIHGKDDTVVPIDQSNDMEGALKRAGKQVEYVKLDGEDHWLSKASTRKAMLEASSAFLQKHLGE